MKQSTPIRITSMALLTLALTGCGFGQGSAAPSATTTAPVQAPNATTAPEGQRIPGGKATWLSNLPDPSKTDTGDSVAVATDYTIASHTWDTATDMTDAYAVQRAALWGTPELRQLEDEYDADQARGQATFNDEASHRTWTSVKVTSTGRDGVAASPDQDAITVNWTMTLHRRDKTKAKASSGTDDVLLVKATDGRWQVQNSSTRQDVQ